MFARVVGLAMHRLARGTPTDLEAIFAAAASGQADIEDAEYPRMCRKRRGPVRFEVPSRGGLIVRVDASRNTFDDFRMACLFERGSFVFASVADLYDFCSGPLARGLGISVKRVKVAQTAAPAETGQTALVEVLVEEARAARARRTLNAASLAKRLEAEIRGQEPALERVGSVVAGQLAKRRPAKPGSVLLLGPTGVGKTATIEALPRALTDLGYAGARVHRIDCAELTDDIQLTRVLGVAPGYVGHSSSTALLEALGAPGVIVLFDEIEKACRELRDLILTLLDTGTITAPDGKRVTCAHAIVALTSNLGWAQLEEALEGVALGDRTTVARITREHLVESGFRAELAGRIGAIAVYGPLSVDAGYDAALQAVRSLGQEYELDVAEVEEVLLDVIADMAAESSAGARGLYHAARDLLSECLADVAQEHGVVRCSIVAGPPPVAVAARQR